MSGPLDNLGRDVAKALDEGPDQERLATQRADFIARASDDLSGRRGRLWLALPATAAVAVVLVLLFLFVGSGPRETGPELTGRIGEDQIEEGQFLRANREASMEVDFSEGSHVSVEPRGRVRLARIQPRAVDLSIEAGAVSSDIVPGHGVEWRFLAGPYRVRVLGTSLRVEWHPSRESLTVEVSEGRVRVTGEELGREGIAVARGQRLSASSDGVQLTRVETERVAEAVESADGPLDGAAVLAPEPALAQSERATTEDQGTPTATAAQGVSSWRQHASAGDYGDAISAAEHEGFDRLVQELPPEHLLELADAARLGGNVQRARQSLLALRQRFAGQRHAHVAAFRLGRLAYDRSRDYREAARWFETALSESPSGPHAADARGRLMESLVRQGRRSDALRVARDYLGRHPDGAYAAAARSIVEQEATE